MLDRMKSLLRRLDLHSESVTESGCQLWTGARHHFGYGVLRNERSKMEAAHRASYRMRFGEIPDGIQVLHRCDVPDCINPSHLFLGTQKDNIHDMMRKGRHNWVRPFGEGHGMAKLTAEQAKKIRNDARRLKDIAAEYGISLSQASAVRRNLSFKES